MVSIIIKEWTTKIELVPTVQKRNAAVLLRKPGRLAPQYAQNTADHLTVVVLVRQYYTGELIVKLHAFAAPEPADHQPLPGTAFALHDAALAVTVDQLATTGRARRDGIIALNIKNRLPHCV